MEQQYRTIDGIKLRQLRTEKGIKNVRTLAIDTNSPYVTLNKIENPKYGEGNLKLEAALRIAKYLDVHPDAFSSVFEPVEKLCEAKWCSESFIPPLSRPDKVYCGSTKDKNSCAYKMHKLKQKETNRKNYELRKAKKKKNEKGEVLCPDYDNNTYVYKLITNNLQPV